MLRSCGAWDLDFGIERPGLRGGQGERDFMESMRDLHGRLTKV